MLSTQTISKTEQIKLLRMICHNLMPVASVTIYIVIKPIAHCGIPDKD